MLFRSASATSGSVQSGDLLRFGQLMNDAGLPVNPTRMLYDRHYAYERLADGFGSESLPLRDLSLDLFEAYQAAGEWLGLAH